MLWTTTGAALPHQEYYGYTGITGVKMEPAKWLREGHRTSRPDPNLKGKRSTAWGDPASGAATAPENIGADGQGRVYFKQEATMPTSTGKMQVHHQLAS